MKETTNRFPFAPEGWHTVTPRIVVHEAEHLVEFLKQVFGATGEYRQARPSEVRIGDSVIMISDARPRRPMTAFLYVYVNDTDATYRRALDAGARALEAPAVTPYGDQRSMVEDKWGNTWQIATHMGDRQAAGASFENQPLISQRGEAMSVKPRTIDEYLEPLSNEKRAALEQLRRAIKSAAPKAEECISYQIPAFRFGGRLLVAFGAAANHCAFYPGAYPVKAHKDELKAYDTSKGTIRFQADSPLPATLVRKLVKTRMAEHARQQPVAVHGARRRR